MTTSHRAAKKQKTKMDILHAAFVLFTGKGFEAVSIAEIMHEARLAPRTFFLYFESKQDLLPTMAHYLARDLQQALLLSAMSPIDAYDSWLRDIKASHAEFMCDQPVHDDELRMRLAYATEKEVIPVIQQALQGQGHSDELAYVVALLLVKHVAVFEESSYTSRHSAYMLALIRHIVSQES